MDPEDVSEGSDQDLDLEDRDDDESDKEEEDEFEEEEDSDGSGADSGDSMSTTEILSLVKENRLLDFFQEELKEMTDVFNETKTMTQKCEDGSYTEEFSDHVQSIRQVFYEESFEKLPFKAKRGCQKMIGDKLAESGSVAVLCKVTAEELQSGRYLFPDEQVAQNSPQMLKEAISAIWNFTDVSSKVAIAVQEDDCLVPVLLKKLEEWSKKYMKNTLDKFTADFLLDASLSIIHNMAMRDENIQYLREQQATKVLQGFLQSKSVDIKITAIAGLADISTDEEAEHLATSEDVVQFLLSILDNALDDEEHDYKGWSGTEIVRAVRQLARNDANKKLLVEQGVLPLLTKGIQSDLEDEKTESIEALWRLSFCKENHPAFVENGELMDLVQKVKYDRQEKDSCRAAAEGILFQLRTELDRREKTQYWAKEFLKRVDFQRKAKIASSAKVKPTTEKTPTAVSQAGHVMLSYNWGHQPLVKKIHDQLVEQGIKVWMDIKKMRGSTRQSMADAVENAFVILVCMSQKYKDSSSCREEAEYAADLKKKIIPLKMQEDYKADGWLGLITAGKLWYDFSDEDQFEHKFQELMTAVREIIGGDAPCDAVDAPVVEQPIVAARVKPIMAQHAGASAVAPSPRQPATSIDIQKIKAWTPKDVEAWRNKVGLTGPKFQRLTGKELVVLYKMHKEASKSFFKTAKKDLQLDLSDVSELSDALDQLPFA